MRGCRKESARLGKESGCRERKENRQSPRVVVRECRCKWGWQTGRACSLKLESREIVTAWATSYFCPAVVTVLGKAHNRIVRTNRYHRTGSGRLGPVVVGLRARKFGVVASSGGVTVARGRGGCVLAGQWPVLHW
jgi:hypothetical protein